LPFDSDGERRRERITRSCGNREALPLDRLWKAEQIGGGKGISRQLSPAADTLGKCYAVSGTHRLGHSGESLLQAVSGRNFRVARHPSSMGKGDFLQSALRGDFLAPKVPFEADS